MFICQFCLRHHFFFLFSSFIFFFLFSSFCFPSFLTICVAAHRTLANLLLNGESVVDDHSYSRASDANAATELARQLLPLRLELEEARRRESQLNQNEKRLLEELDRHVRNESRTTHNLEYLKNLIVKFLESDSATARVR